MADGPGRSFSERFVAADGFRIRYLEAGQGAPLLHLHGAGGLCLSRAHELLAQTRRVVALEIPGFGDSAENTRSATLPDLAATLAAAISALGVTRFDLWGTSFGAKVALWLAALQPARVSALVLESPAAIRPAGVRPPSGSPEQIARLVFAHPERMAPRAALPAAVADKQQALVMRLRGPDRDAALEAEMRALTVPTLVVFGTLDRMMPPALGRLYKQLIPGSHLVFVYDAGHAITAERPEAFVEVAADFLQRHAAFVISQKPTLLFP